jgi:hypothetical protein
MPEREAGRYPFVNDSPATEPGRTAALVRRQNISHALRHIHRQTREVRTKEHLSSTSIGLTERQRSRKSTNERLLESRHGKLEETTHLGTDPEYYLLGALGQGRLYPFEVYPNQNTPAYIHEIIDHGECLKIQAVELNLLQWWNVCVKLC